jgi:hypothetical protein
MATITLKYDARNPVLKSILDTAIIAGAKVVDATKTKKTANKSFNSETLRAINDAKIGKTEKISLAQFRKQLY